MGEGPGWDPTGCSGFSGASGEVTGPQAPARPVGGRDSDEKKVDISYSPDCGGGLPSEMVPEGHLCAQEQRQPGHKGRAQVSGGDKGLSSLNGALTMHQARHRGDCVHVSPLHEAGLFSSHLTLEEPEAQRG